MSKYQQYSRRQFLSMVSLGAAGIVLNGCDEKSNDAPAQRSIDIPIEEYYNQALLKVSKEDASGLDMLKTIDIYYPDSSDANFIAGNMLTLFGGRDSKVATKNAIRKYEKAIKIDPTHGAAYLNMGTCYYALGLPTAEDEQMRLSGTFAIRYERKVLIDKALECYDKAIKLDSNKFAAYYGKGLTKLSALTYRSAMGDMSAARNYASLGKDQVSTSIPSLSEERKGAVMTLLKPICLVGASIKYVVDNVMTVDLGGEKLTQLDFNENISYSRGEDDFQAFTLYQIGKMQFQNRNFSGAIRNFDSAIELNSNVMLFYMFKIVAQTQNGDVTGALKTKENGEKVKQRLNDLLQSELKKRLSQ